MPIYHDSCYDVVSVSKTYGDLRHLADDKTVLENPHKGWYYHFLDNGYARPAYRDRLTEGQRLTTPGLNYMYLRFDWGDIEKEEGIYDWSYLEHVLESWGALGYKFTLRICTFEGANITYATPKWLIDRGVGATHVIPEGAVSSDPNLSVEEMKKGSYEPDYGHPLYLEKLDAFLAEHGKKVDKVLDIAVEKEELMIRLLGRRVCKACGASFHVKNMPPKVEGVCDNCGGELIQRADDNEETVSNRIEVYNSQTMPLVEYYEKAGNIAHIDGAIGLENVFNSIVSALGE